MAHLPSGLGTTFCLGRFFRPIGLIFGLLGGLFMLNPNMKLSGRKIVKKVLKQKPTLVGKGHLFGV